MKLKEKIIVFILCGIVSCFCLFVNSYNDINSRAQKLYNVYLDGTLLGTIDNKDELYELIDKKQQDIKDKYNVTNVYPPNGLEIVETYSYNTEIDNLSTIPAIFMYSSPTSCP